MGACENALSEMSKDSVITLYVESLDIRDKLKEEVETLRERVKALEGTNDSLEIGRQHLVGVIKVLREQLKEEKEDA